MIGSEFANIPEQRILPGISGLKQMKFVGPLHDALVLFGHPDQLTFALSTDDTDPEWRVLYHVAWSNGGEIFGGFDPSAFIYMWNASITEIETIKCRLEIDKDVAEHQRETIYLSPSFQPTRLRMGAAGAFESASLFLHIKNYPESLPQNKSQKPPSRGFFNVPIDSSN